MPTSAAPRRSPGTALAPLLLALLLLAPTPAGAGNVAVDVFGTAVEKDNLKWGTWTNTANIYQTDQAWTSFSYTAAAPSPYNGWSAIGVNFSGMKVGSDRSTWTENKKGYIRQLRFYFDYRLYPAPFVDDRFEGSYVLKKNAAWYASPYLAPDNPVTDATAVSDTTTMKYNSYSVDGLPGKPLPALTDGNTWKNLSDALMIRVMWMGYNGANLSTVWADVDDTTVYIDGCYVKAYTKTTINCAPITTSSPYYAVQGDPAHPLFRFQIKPFADTTFGLNSLSFTLTGTSTVTVDDIASAKLYRDADLDGVFDGAALETLVATATVSGTPLAGTFTGAPLIPYVPANATNRYWFVVLAIKDTATPGRTADIVVDAPNFVVSDAGDEIAVKADQDRTGTVYTNTTTSLNDTYPLFPFSPPVESTIRQKATVSIASVTPSVTSVAQGVNFTVTVRMANAANCNTASEVKPATPVFTFTDGAEAAFQSVTPASASIAGGAYQDFVFTFRAMMPGWITRTDVTATGKDATTLAALTIAPGFSETDIQITKAPVFFRRLEIVPTSVSSDKDSFEVFIEVTNNLDYAIGPVTIANLAGTAWTLTKTGSGAATQNSYTPGSQTIGIGATAYWTFVFTPTAPTTANPGDFTLSCQALGTGLATPPVGTSNALTIWPYANPTIAAATIPATKVGVNGKLTFYLTVSVPAGFYGTALDLVPTPLQPAAVEQPVPGNGNPDPTYLSGPIPASVASLGPGQSTTFEWIYDANGDITAYGKYTWTAGLKYTDSISLWPYTSANYTCPVVEVVPIPVPVATKSVGGAVKKMITYSEDFTYYVLDESGLLTAYRPDATFSVKWTYNFATILSDAGDSITNAANRMIACTESATGNVIWFGTSLGSVYAVRDGGAGAAGHFSPAVADSYTSVGNAPVIGGPIVWNKYLYATTSTRVAKRDAVTGSIPSSPAWVDYVITTAGVTITTPPAMNNNYIYFGASDGRLYCIDAGLGTFVAATPQIPPAAGIPITASPFIMDEGEILGAAGDGTLFRINNPADLATIIKVDVNGAAAPTTFSDLWVGIDFDFVWVCDKTNGILYKCNFNTLAVAGTRTFTGRTLTDPIEWRGIVYVSTRYLNTAPNPDQWEGEFYAINKTTLANITIWPYPVGLANSGSNCPITVDNYNDILVVGTDDSKVYFFDLPLP